MPRVSGRRGQRCLGTASLIAILALTVGCSGDDPQEPDDGNGNETVVLSAENAGEWSVIILHYFTNSSGCSFDGFERSTDVGDILQNGTFRVRTYSYGSGTCCLQERYNCSIESTKLVDLTPYKTARLKGQLRMYMQQQPVSCGIEVRADFCGLDRLVNESLCGDANGAVVTKDFDLNIGDALDCARGTFYLTINVFGWCGGQLLAENEVYVEMRDLRIVVTK